MFLYITEFNRKKKKQEKRIKTREGRKRHSGCMCVGRDEKTGSDRLLEPTGDTRWKVVEDKGSTKAAGLKCGCRDLTRYSWWES